MSSDNTEQENKMLGVFNQIAATYEPPKEEDMIILGENNKIRGKQQQYKLQPSFNRRQQQYEMVCVENEGATTTTVIMEDEHHNFIKNQQQLIENEDINNNNDDNNSYSQKQNQDQNMDLDNNNQQHFMQQKKQEQKIIQNRKKNKAKQQQQKDNEEIKQISKADFKYDPSNKVANILQDEEEIGEVGEMIEKTANKNFIADRDEVDSDDRQLQQNEDDEFDQAFEDGEKGISYQKQSQQNNNNNENNRKDNDNDVGDIFENNNEKQNQNKINNILQNEQLQKAAEEREKLQQKANQKLKGKTSTLGTRSGYMVNKLSSKAALIKVNEESIKDNQNNINKNDQSGKNQIQEITETEEKEEENQNTNLNKQQKDNNNNENQSKKKKKEKILNCNGQLSNEEINPEPVGENQFDTKDDFNDDIMEEEEKDKVMSPEAMKRLSNEKQRKSNPKLIGGKQPVISNDEWDMITKETLHVQKKRSSVQKSIQPIQYIDALEKIRNMDLSQQVKLIHSESTGEQTFIQKLFGFCSKSNQIQKPCLLTERDRILAFTKVKYDDQDTFHFQMLYTIYTELRQTDICLRYGSHWEEIGFQGSDPATDIRAGMLGILQILAFVSRYKVFLISVVEYSQIEQYSFPLCCTLLNISVDVINIAKEGRLNSLINAEKQVISIINVMFFSAFYAFFESYKKNKYTIHQIGDCLKQTRELIQREPNKLISNFKKKIDRFNKNHEQQE